jgi:hypothetical protein
MIHRCCRQRAHLRVDGGGELAEVVVYLKRSAHLRLARRVHARTQRGGSARSDVTPGAGDPPRVPIDDVNASQVTVALARQLADVREHLRRLGQVARRSTRGESDLATAAADWLRAAELAPTVQWEPAAAAARAQDLLKARDELEHADDAVQRVHRRGQVLQLARLGCHRTVRLDHLLPHSRHGLSQ